MESIETDRLTLRPLTAHNADFVFDVFRRPEVARWSGGGSPMAHRDEAVERIRCYPACAGDHPGAWSNGYATEATQAVLDRGFAAGLDEVIAVIQPDNAASQAVCRRLGMTDLGLRSSWYDEELRAFRLDCQ